MMRALSYCGYWFAPAVIQHVVWCYLHFALRLDLTTDTEPQAAVEQATDAAIPTDTPPLATVDIRLQMLFPEFDPRDYGFKKLNDLLSTIPTVKLTWEGEPPRVYVERQ